MKRAAVAFSILLAGCGVLLGDSPSSRSQSRERARVLQEIVQLTNAGSSSETVLAYAKAHRLELPQELSNDDLLWLRESGVSERVVAYMAAIDVRASDEAARQAAAYDSHEPVARPRAAYTRADGDYENGPASDYDTYADSDYGYPDSYSNAYPIGYDDGYYPFYGGYYLSAYPAFFFVDRGFSGRFHGRGHRFGGHRGGFIGHRGFGHGGFGRPHAGRDFGGRRGRAVAVGPRRSGPPAFARSGFAAGPRGPRGGAVGRGGFGRPGFAGGGRAGASFGRGTVGHAGGGRGTVGPPGGRGRR